MNGLLIVTHSVLGKGLLMAAEAILGPLHRAEAVCLQKEDSVEKINRKVKEGIASVAGENEGVIVMADMFGGTPCNISLAFLDREHLEVVTGANLPMVLKFFQNCHEPSLLRLAGMIRDAGREGIAVPGELLRERVVVHREGISPSRKDKG